MKSIAVCALSLVLASSARADGLTIRVVDAETGKHIAGVMVERWASQWQPRILKLPGRFWFPEKGVATDAEGRVVIDKIAGDDRYSFETEGYENGWVTPGWDGFKLAGRAGGKPTDLAKQSGVLVVPLRPNKPKGDR